MLECWGSNPEDRPSFAKIVSLFSNTLETMFRYVQILPRDCTEQVALTNHMTLNPVASESHDMEGEIIETVACEAYTSTSSTQFGREVAPHKTNHIAIIPVASDMEGERIVTIACEAYTSTSSTKLGIQPPVADDHDGHNRMGVVTEDGSEYI